MHRFWSTRRRLLRHARFTWLDSTAMKKLTTIAVLLLAGCAPDNDSITDCSRRDLPQHYDASRGRWTCDDESDRGNHRSSMWLAIATICGGLTVGAGACSIGGLRRLRA